MSERLGIVIRNLLLDKIREVLKDGVMKIYSGAAPATADMAVTGVELAVISVAGGTVSTDEFAIPSRWLVTIPGAHVAGTYAVTINVDSVNYTCTFNANVAADHDDNDTIANGLARAINKDCPQVFAIGAGDETTPVSSNIYIQAKIGNLHVGIIDGGGTITITTLTELLPAHAAVDTLQFAKSSAGAMSKSTAVWSDTVIVSGVAGYFRIVTSHDDGTLDTATLDQPRLQGTISTSGAELNLSNTSLVAGTTLTIDTYSVSLPAE
jgi:hypothetical protein